MGTSYFGDNKFSVNFFKFNLEKGEEMGNATIGVTVKGCTPFYRELMGKYFGCKWPLHVNGTSFHYSIHFTGKEYYAYVNNIYFGEKNPDQNILPPLNRQKNHRYTSSAL